ncbi:hypothetical protein M501DRAFT_1030274 [Patellaria atrata CBS 101060]|uniref:non-specific serine/threonine protein kinase n=1 Tax=Patellaria atrata CBS 101060 TaxID=1346257 RepID=A0A9P4VNP8_9PEZI|nr:hypothetical protein M501DRAFT_1030274 [Patellaria atrata CBS 101060]
METFRMLPIFNIKESPVPLNLADNSIISMAAKLFDPRTLSVLRYPRIAIGMSTLRTARIISSKRVPDGDSKNFYPVNRGDRFHNLYEMMTNLGHGSFFNCLASSGYSTVWWLQSSRYVAVKVTVASTNQEAKHELSVARRLETNSVHEGYLFVRPLLGSFDIFRPDGRMHLCIVYESMREPTLPISAVLGGRSIATPPSNGLLEAAFKGLDYLQSQCHIIHTDLKQDNILMGFEDSSVLDDIV